MPVRTRLFVSASIVVLTLMGYFHLPGHTYLQSDTQIYVPILEHFWNPHVFDRELLAQDPHVSFTIYDETALGLRRLTGLDFHYVLALEQIVFRALGLLGVFLLATSLGLRAPPALLVTALFSYGATIIGPAVLTIEYEPVPRGFAIPLLLFAVGLVAHGRDLMAGAAAALAFLYHPPTVLPFWAVYFALTLWPAPPSIMRRRILGLLPMLAGVAVLLVMSRLQAGITEPQDFFSRISPELERLQRMRASYNWLTTWPRELFLQYLFLWGVSLAAFWRLRKWMSQDVRFFAAGLPAFGILMLPMSYILLDRLKWIVMPQAQPARALLFITAMAIILGGIAGVKAAEGRRWWEAVLWFTVPFAIEIQAELLKVRSLSDPLIRIRLAVIVGLALLAVFALWAFQRKVRWALVIWAIAIVLPSYAMPRWAKVQNYPSLLAPPLLQLSQWARETTPQRAVFFFPDMSKELTPGVFRAESLRAVYVDWKGGGQVNFLKNFASKWWVRWEESGAGKYSGVNLPLYRSLGIDYIVLLRPHRLVNAIPLFENSDYVVYATASTPATSG